MMLLGYILLTLFGAFWISGFLRHRIEKADGLPLEEGQGAALFTMGLFFMFFIGSPVIGVLLMVLWYKITEFMGSILAFVAI